MITSTWVAKRPTHEKIIEDINGPYHWKGLEAESEIDRSGLSSVRMEASGKSLNLTGPQYDHL